MAKFKVPQKPSWEMLTAAIVCLFMSVLTAWAFFHMLQNLSAIPPKPNWPMSATMAEYEEWKTLYEKERGSLIVGVVLTSVAFAALTAIWIPLMSVYRRRRKYWKSRQWRR